MRTHGRFGARGFTLIEVVVALLLLEILLLGALVTLHLATAHVRRARVFESAVWDAAAWADSVAAGGSAVAADRAWGWLSVSGDAVEARDSTGALLLRIGMPPGAAP
ncbi:MAG: prepilin-type N-terminal cleavage/methylation domain-containing protein [Longimicrobiales bacterium]|nr:prepilin-type N-terminal cleavage/methylation domain-containing protein [Longimicrobiales bacterium]